MKALNYNDNKPRWSLLLQDMKFSMNEMLKVREMGAVKYDRMNFIQSKGTEDAKEFLDDNLDSIYRHLAEAGDVDEESKCYHMAHVAVRAMFALEYLQEDSDEDKYGELPSDVKEILLARQMTEALKACVPLHQEEYSPIREFDES